MGSSTGLLILVLELFLKRFLHQPLSKADDNVRGQPVRRDRARAIPPRVMATSASTRATAPPTTPLPVPGPPLAIAKFSAPLITAISPAASATTAPVLPLPAPIRPAERARASPPTTNPARAHAGQRQHGGHGGPESPGCQAVNRGGGWLRKMRGHQHSMHKTSEKGGYSQGAENKKEGSLHRISIRSLLNGG